MRIVTVPLNSDNFGYIVIHEETSHAMIIDVSSQPDQMADVAKKHKVDVKMVLSTHKHWDHSGGNDRLKELIPNIEVCGHEVDQCEGCTRFVSDGESFDFHDIKVRCLHTPGHTQGHICYYLTHGEQQAVFTGDILFIGGAGRFFEGTAKDVYESFQKLLSLPHDTLVYCGHEYTLANYKFALNVDSSNAELMEANRQAQEKIDNGKHTVPSTIGQELKTNPFIRSMTAMDEIKLGLGADAKDIEDPVSLLAAVREAKNRFK